eukprot:g1053.t1
MEVVIAQGRKGKIEVRSGDIFVELARRFVAEHGLAESAVAKLQRHIETEVAKLPSTTLASALQSQPDDDTEPGVEAQQQRTSRTRKGKKAKKAKRKRSKSGRGGGSTAQRGSDGNGSGSGRGALRRRERDMKATFERLNGEARVRETRLQLAVKAKAQADHEAVERARVPKTRKSLEIQSYVLHRGSENVCERLYKSGCEALQRRYETSDRHVARVREAQEMEECTFQPKIGRESSDIALRRRREQAEAAVAAITNGGARPSRIGGADVASALMQRTSMGIHDRLYADAEHKEHQRQLQMVAEESARQQHTFVPAISATSQQLAQERRLAQNAAADGHGSDSSDGIHVKLHRDAEQRRARMRQFQLWHMERFSHVPDIGIDKLRPGSDESSEAFVNRLAYGHFTHQERLNKLHEKHHGEFDPQTGQRLFQPRVGRGPVFERNAAGLPIGEFLFSARHEFHDARSRIAKAEADELHRNRTSKKISKESERLVEKMKLNAFWEIFETLVATVAFHRERELRQRVEEGHAAEEELAAASNFVVDRDTRLDTAAADASLLKPDISAIVGPMLKEFGGKHVTLPEFAAALETRISSLSLSGAPLFNLLAHHKTKQEAVDDLLLQERENATFQPQLAKKTRQMRRNSTVGGARLQELYEEGATWQAKRAHHGQLKLEAEMKECTFMPVTNRSAKWQARYREKKPTAAGTAAAAPGTVSVPPQPKQRQEQKQQRSIRGGGGTRGRSSSSSRGKVTVTNDSMEHKGDVV